MLTQIINGRILTPQGWLKDGSVLICDGKTGMQNTFRFSILNHSQCYAVLHASSRIKRFNLYNQTSFQVVTCIIVTKFQ